MCRAKVRQLVWSCMPDFETCLLCCAQALKGGYVEPGPGGDPIRNPSVLPTGKNIHALDPQSIPTQAALKSARIVVERFAFDPVPPASQYWLCPVLLVPSVVCLLCLHRNNGHCEVKKIGKAWRGATLGVVAAVSGLPEQVPSG